MAGRRKLPRSDSWWDGDLLARLPLADAANKLVVLHEDNHVLAVFKPAGLLTQGPARNQNSLVDIVKQWIKAKYQKPGNVYTAPIHRLDRPVCGVVVFGKTSKAAGRLSEQMRKRVISKTYLAIVRGGLEKQEGVLEGYLRKREKDRKMLVYGIRLVESSYAVMTYRVLERGESRSLVEIRPETGRRHQIRALLASAGAPIWGDCKYGDGPKLRNIIGLLAYRISFRHPTKGKKITVVSPFPPNWPWPED